MSCKMLDVGFVGTKASECFEMPILFGLLKKKGINFNKHTFIDYDGLNGLNHHIRIGNVIPLFEFFNPEDVSTEDTMFEEGSLSVYTDFGNLKLKAENHLSLCGHRSLLKARDSGFEEFIEVTKDNKYGVVLGDNGTMKGQEIGRLLISSRKRALKDKLPTTEVTVPFKGRTEFENKGYYLEVDYSPFVDLVRIETLDSYRVLFSANWAQARFNDLGCSDNNLLSQGFTLFNNLTVPTQEVITSITITGNDVEIDTQNNIFSGFTLKYNNGDIYWSHKFSSGDEI